MNKKSKKTYPDVVSALDGLLFDGMSIMSGGFGACGIADLCIQEIRRLQIKDLTLISNNCGGQFPNRSDEGFGLWTLLKDRLVRRAISSYIGTNKTFEQQYLDKEIELEPLTTRDIDCIAIAKQYNIDLYGFCLIIYICSAMDILFLQQRFNTRKF